MKKNKYNTQDIYHRKHENIARYYNDQDDEYFEDEDNFEDVDESI